MIDITVVKVNERSYSCKSKLVYMKTMDHVANLIILQVDQVQMDSPTSYRKIRTVFSNPSETLQDNSERFAMIRKALIGKITRKYNLNRLLV